MTVKPARLREIAQAVAGYLNLTTQLWAGQFTFTAKRSYWTNYAMKDMDPNNGGALQVDILLGLQDWQEESRGSEIGDYGVSIVLQQKVDRTATADVDDLIDLVAAIADAFILGRTFVPAWSSGKTYVAGDFAMGTDTYTYRSRVEQANHAPPNAIYWQAVNPIMVAEKHNPIVYNPKEGDNRNAFMAALDLVFRHDSEIT